MRRFAAQATGITLQWAGKFTAGPRLLTRPLRGEAPHPGPRLTVGHVMVTGYAPVPGNRGRTPEWAVL